MSAQPDPIFELIQRYLDLETAVERAPDDETILGALVGEQARVRVEIAETAPTTIKGLAALARFLDHHSHVVLKRDPFFSDEAEHLAFYASLNRSLSALTCANARA